ncbi:beclin 1-associated autophagy-related key regulator [Trichonephila clavata]|uniref:Beclin 1-associated autophagy-related key regulator n=1 Tax=Trichonephila clavata TaxID=2740835 RepID=A0A8X6HW83_TRICU|nr:beclin 1-associated autophagy-related key regulator [Trichonephila clavata]
MASSSDEGLDESIPEMVYQDISLTETHNYIRDDTYLKCQLCNQCKKHFYCIDCIRNGNFRHSKTNIYESFADKKPKQYRLNEEKENLLKKYEAILSRKREVENMRFDIEQRKEKIQLLEKGIKFCKTDILKDRKLIEDLKERKHKLIKRDKAFTERLSAVKKNNEIFNTAVESKKSKLKLKQSALESLIQKRVEELVTYIFPISKAPSSFYKDLASSERQKKAELQEAQTFTYIEGSWTYDNPSDNAYSIVEPYLIPCDYSPDTNWNEIMVFPASTTNISGDNSDHYNAGYVNSAALAYEAQLVHTISYVMNCQVPRRTCFNDFCKYDSVEKFSHAVAKLNANIINLCIARHVDLSKLKPTGTMSNLMTLIYPESNREDKSVTPEERECLLSSLEKVISSKLLPVSDSDDDNTDDLEAEFVHVSDEEVPVTLPAPIPEPVPIHTSLLSSLWKAIGQK